MKHVTFLLGLMVLLFTACDNEDDIPNLTGTVTISIDNQSLFNQDNYSVRAGIVFFETDDQPLVDFEERDISNGGSVTFSPVTLNSGNYYVRYQYLLNGSDSGSERHQSFQIQAGEDVDVTVVR
ncbi:MAG: hypothetical protein AAF433_19905 [Bacteroidota bacterium]